MKPLAVKLKRILPVILLLISTSLSAGPYLKVTGWDYVSEYPYAKVNVIININPIDSPSFTEENLSVYENDFLVNIHQVKKTVNAGEPVYLVIAADSSGSVTEEYIGRAKRFASQFLLQDLQNIKIAYYRFNDNVNIITPFTKNPVEIRDSIANLQRHGKFTMLNNALYDAIDVVSREKSRKRCVVVLTDGKDEGSSVTDDDVANFAKEKGVILIFISPSHTEYLSKMSRLAKLSGGRHYLIEDADALEKTVNTVKLLQNEYTIKYQTQYHNDGEPHNAEIRLKVGNLRDREEFSFNMGSTWSVGAVTGFLGKNIHFILGALALISMLVLLIAAVPKLITFSGKKDVPDYETIDTFIEERPAVVRPVQIAAVKKAEEVLQSKPTGERKNIPVADQKNMPLQVTPQKEEGAAATEQATVDFTGSPEKVPQSESGAPDGYVHKIWLMIKAEDGTLKKLTVKGTQAVIGKARGCDIRFKDNNLNDKHAMIKLNKNGFFIYDMATDSGTFLNGKKLLRPKLLYDWDEIQVGTTVFIFRTVQE